MNGTEPLMHREYLETYRMLGQWKTMTNGLVFKNNFDYLDEIRSYGITVLNISYHFDFQDQISSVSKSYLMELWKEMHARRMRFTFNCTLSKNTMHNIVRYAQEALSYGAYRIHFTNLLQQGAANSLDSGLFLNQSDINYVLETVNSTRKMFNKDELYVDRCGGFGPFPGSNFYCPAGTGRAYITPDLKVYPCIFLVKPGFEIGYYKDGTIYIRDDYRNDGKYCLALKALNHI